MSTGRIMALAGAFVCGAALMLAANGPQRKLVIKLKSGQTVEYVTRSVEDITFQVPEKLIPSVELAAGVATPNSLSFTLSPTNAGKVAYVCLPADAVVPDAAKILAEGMEAAADKAGDYTVSGLEAETDYVIVAVAKSANSDETVVSEPLSMTTEAVPEPKVGDIYYSDGTWSTELDAAKTPIGIVFYVGAATGYNDYAANYRLKDGSTPMGGVRGYVVALRDANYVNGTKTPVMWSFWDGSYEGAGCSSQTNDFLGYTNTLSIAEAAKERPGALTPNADSFPAAYYATTAYEEACPAPETSSGWFLPSCYQLEYIFQKVYFNSTGTAAVWLEKVFEALGDAAEPMYASGSEYWSSTEKYDSSGCSYFAYYYSFDSSMIKPGFGADFRKNGTCNVRSVLVF